jgi:hypothetical protein
VRKRTVCIYPDCQRWASGQGRCGMHYQRDMKAGVIKGLTPEERFWTKVEKTDGCWLWRGVVDHQSGSYGRYGGVRAHRIAYEYLVGPIPDGLVIDHRCQNRICVNPAHLRVCTIKQNTEHMVPRPQFAGRGVHWHKNSKRWTVTVMHHRQRFYGGCYKTFDEANAAAIALRNRLYTHNDLDRGESVA